MDPLELRFEVDGEGVTVPLNDRDLRLGRGGDCEVVLPDPSVSRQHALLTRRGGRWWVVDLGSTNGITVNGESVREASLTAGDRLSVGNFELRVAVPPPPSPPPTAAMSRGLSLDDSGPVPHTQLVRPLADVMSQLGLEQGQWAAKRSELDEAYGNRVFGYLLRLASSLLTAGSVDEVLARVTDLAFEALPVRRGFILLLDQASGELVCELARLEERTVYRPSEAVPVSRTILKRVLEEKVALITLDAKSDSRLEHGASIRIHDIRAAMSVPLCSGDRIIGVLQVDSPLSREAFSAPDLDFLTALANYAAVAVERLRNREEAEREGRLRRWLARYHAPTVIEAVLGLEGGSEELARLVPAEVTVLFADLVGFSRLAEALAPAVVADLLAEFFDAAEEAIFSSGGTLDKFIGDCVMAFFGAPFAQPDHASRAVAAALGIRRGLARINRGRVGRGLPPLSARIGLQSGPVVVGEVGSSRRVEYTVLGNTVNVASRLAGEVAGPGEIVLGGATWRGVEGSLAVTPLGRVRLTGLSQEVEVVRVEEAGLA